MDLKKKKPLSEIGEKLIDNWFSQNEQALLRSAREKMKKKKELENKKRIEDEALKLKELHWMKCPKCGNDMALIEIEGIELDKCTTCEGIYFDAGELDDLLLKKADERKSFFRKLVSPIIGK